MLTLCTAAILVSGCEKTQPELPAEPESAPPRVRFTDVTREVGLADFLHVTGAFGKKWFPETMGSGLAVVDFDGDGWLDLMVASGGVWPESGIEAPQAVRLFRNVAGAFSEVAAGVVPADPAYSFGFAAADFDNDGDVDVYVTTLGRNVLLRNEGGRFVDATADAGLTSAESWSTAASFFDADRDGFVDLFVGNYVRWTPENDLRCSTTGREKTYCTPELYEAAGGRFFRNRGDGTFVDRTLEAGFERTGKVLGAVALDYNEDGWPDLFIANDTDPDQLFENQGDGRFVDVGTKVGVAFDERGRARAGMGVDAGYTDQTGGVSIFVGNFTDQMIGIYRYQGSRVFLDRAAVSRVGRPSLPSMTFGLLLLDADLNGALDLFAANGHIQDDVERIIENTTYRQPAHLFMNSGDGTFVAVGPEAGLAEPIVGRGAVQFDFDRDGDVDIAVSENGGRLRLWQNELNPDSGYLRVALKGIASNRQGIGAAISLYSGQGEQRRTITAGSSYLSSSEPVATFGIPDDTIDSLVVRWPSGQRTSYDHPEIGGEYVVSENANLEPSQTSEHN